MALHYVDPAAVLDTGMMHRIDEEYARSRGALPEVVAEAVELVGQRGPAVAAALLGVEHIARTGGSVQELAGALGLALVELARREVE